MKNNLKTLMTALACFTCLTQAEPTKEINFLAFGDGGYHVDYPKAKHIKKPKNRQQFLAAEVADWLEDHRAIEDFDHAPIYVYPGTHIATEKGGALAVGTAMAKYCEQAACEFGIQLGDNIYPDGADANDGKDDQQRMNDLILKPLLPVIKQNPEFMIYSALGNHDWKTSRKGVALQTEWMQKQANFHMDSQGYYRYTKGTPGNDVEFFVLDTNMLLSAHPFYEAPLNPDGSEMSVAEAKQKGVGEYENPEPHERPKQGEYERQLNWLKQGLATSKAKWKIVYGHHILWSVGGTKYAEGHILREILMPTLCANADAYIAGHEHDLELLSDDCSQYGQSHKPKLPLIISGAASKMRGQHSKFAKWQEKNYPQMDYIWGKAFIWGFANVNLNTEQNQLRVDFFTTPRDGSGKLIEEKQFTFQRRSTN